jgi:superfamily II DNA or RNA helicase
MITLKITNQIEMGVGSIPDSLFQKIKADLTLKNPQYYNALHYGFDTKGKPKNIVLYRIDPNRENIIIPRGYGGKIIKYLQDHKMKYKIEDDRQLLPKVEFHSRIKPRDYQEKAIRKIVQWRQGGIVAPCGAGKTMIMLEAMARIGQPSLWITHTKELTKQVMNRACEVFDITEEEIGLIGDGNFSIGKRLTIALIQTLSKADLEQIKDHFGAIFIDEAHHMAAKSFFHPIGQFTALYRIWVSATPEREDGLTDMVFAAGGPIVHIIQQKEVPTIIPELRVIKTDYCSPEDEYVQLIGELIKDPSRNQLIVDTIATEVEGNYSLVLSDRVEHLTILKRILEYQLPNKRIAILTGSMKKTERAAVMEQVQNKELDILLATQLAREGLDIKHLNRLFLITPKKAAGAIIQEVGRIMRPDEGKNDAIVYDFFDENHGILKNQFWKRWKIYKDLGMNYKFISLANYRAY